MRITAKARVEGRAKWDHDHSGPVEMMLAVPKTYSVAQRKGRLYLSLGDPKVQDPVGPECTDWACEGWSCRMKHAKVLLEALGFEWSGRLAGAADDAWVSRAEVDHGVWKKYRTAALKEYREVLATAVDEGALPEIGKMSWSGKAGCSCACSPGFVLDDPKWRGMDVYVDARYEEKEEA